MKSHTYLPHSTTMIIMANGLSCVESNILAFMVLTRFRHLYTCDFVINVMDEFLKHCTGYASEILRDMKKMTNVSGGSIGNILALLMLLQKNMPMHKHEVIDVAMSAARNSSNFSITTWNAWQSVCESSISESFDKFDYDYTYLIESATLVQLTILHSPIKFQTTAFDASADVIEHFLEFIILYYSAIRDHAAYTGICSYMKQILQIILLPEEYRDSCSQLFSACIHAIALYQFPLLLKDKLLVAAQCYNNIPFYCIPTIVVAGYCTIFENAPMDDFSSWFSSFFLFASRQKIPSSQYLLATTLQRVKSRISDAIWQDAVQDYATDDFFGKRVNKTLRLLHLLPIFHTFPHVALSKLADVAFAM